MIIRKTREHIRKSKYHLAIGFILMGLMTGIWVILHPTSTVKAFTLQPLQAGNQPIGIAKGTIPGRVVWIHNPEATNEDCTNSSGDLWYESSNTDQTVVNNMVSTGIRKMTGAATDAAAWDSIFHYYNRTHDRGDVGYTTGEKIVIKINLNGGDACSNINTSPQVCYSILDQLINNAGVSQPNISIGDPNFQCGSATWDACHPTFPNVRYWGNFGSGRSSVIKSTEKVFKLSSGDWDLNIPQDYVDATYMINIPVFKKHHRAGISLCCKNHFGSIAVFTGGASLLHPYLPCPEATGEAANGSYGVYRVFVDIMGHKDLGGKTILYLIDGLWGSVNWGHPAVKWEMSPFSNDWPSSLFLSQDPVAIESVCFDFLYHEFDEDHPTEGIDKMSENAGPFPHFPGTDDYLHQAADPTKWPAGFEYDPEDDGTILTSLGTHEHWNNATEKEYSRNLGTGNGIELLYVYGTTDINAPVADSYQKFISHPNPFIGSTSIHYKLDLLSDIKLFIYNSEGKIIHSVALKSQNAGEYDYRWDSNNSNTVTPAGTYFCNIEITNNQGKSTITGKMICLN